MTIRSLLLGVAAALACISFSSLASAAEPGGGGNFTPWVKSSAYCPVPSTDLVAGIEDTVLTPQLAIIEVGIIQPTGEDPFPGITGDDIGFSPQLADGSGRLGKHPNLPWDKRPIIKGGTRLVEALGGPKATKDLPWPRHLAAASPDPIQLGPALIKEI